MKRHAMAFIAVLLMSAVLSPSLSAQGTRADYERAAGLQAKFRNLAAGVVDRTGWIEDTPRFWYRRSVTGGAEFMVMDAESLAKRPAFDHARLAAALSKAAGESFAALDLPILSLQFTAGEKAVEFEAAGSRWRCGLADYGIERLGPARRGGGGDPFAPRPAPPSEPKISPDKRWEAFIRNFNVWLRSTEDGTEFPLSWEGSEGDYYAGPSLCWSPDSKKLAGCRIKPGHRRVVHYVESSPADQLQPKHHTFDYPKPGDVMDHGRPILFHVDGPRQFIVDDALFPNPYHQPGIGPNGRVMPDCEWRKDSRAFTFEYNQRGHQLYRVIEVDAATGTPHVLIDEPCETFFFYTGKKFRSDVDDGREIVWMSERDGWNHLYLFDGATGRVKNRITRGEWVVRGVDKVDEAARRIWFQASGMNPGQDPYQIHHYRIDFDGTGLTPLTEGDGTHAVVFSSDMKYCVDTWSRADAPPVCKLRRTEDGKVLAVVEKADIAALVEAGWRAPKPFAAKGRDGKTDIYGLIFRPTNFDPSKTYPVIEYIYAGPHDSFVPKAFSPWHAMQSLAEVGFIVSQVDGMGTSNRSKAFHDVCWKNIGDAGFPDRILWHKAVAAKYPWYDISRVGIYGGSAGGQNSTGALLFHPEFYKAAVSFAGCHDNRMDKLWWNEQWMGWPIGPEYAASSNVENAHRLRGRLLLIVGELDTNVDPASTMQVVDALLKANKDFDLLVIPGGSHGAGRRGEYPEYGDRKRNDFFVRHLLGVEPPDWNAAAGK